jgi:plastocyanin
VVLVGAVLFAGSAPSAAQGALRVEMRNFMFDPAVVRIEAGKRVLFVNRDRVRHDAFKRGAFDTGRLSFGESALVRFTHRGVYPYFCTLHPYYMRGKVIVD